MRPENDNSSSTAGHNSNGEIQFQLQIGSKLFPQYAMRSHGECFYQLKKCLGVQSSTLHNFDINGHEYRDNKFIIGIDCEKVLEASYTGLNTRSGDLLVVKMQYNPNNDAARYANRLHIVLHSDQVMEIKDTGCQIFD